MLSSVAPFLLCLAIAGPALGLDYVAYGPKSVRKNSVYPVTVLCMNASSDVNVTITLSVDGSKSPLAQQSSMFPQGKKSALTIYLPLTRIPPLAKIKLTLSGTDSTDFFESRADLSESLDESRKTIFLFTQTDQPLYQAKKTVKFRVLTVNQRLMPIYSPLTIRVKDPQGNVIKQFLNASDAQLPGYFYGEVPLSSDPILGTWKISAETSDGKTQSVKEFSVDEYVLPRFDVKITAPAHVAYGSEDFMMAVEASYTFGGPVRGTLNVTLASGRGKLKTYEKLDINGRLTLNLRTKDIMRALDLSDSSDQSVTVSANVTETLTGTMRNATASSIALKKDLYKIELMTTNSQTFLPGFSFAFRAKIVDLDGRPVALSGKQLTLETSYYTQRNSDGVQIPGKKPAVNTTTPAPTGDEEVSDTPEEKASAIFRPWTPRPWPQTKRIDPESVSVQVPADGVVTIPISTPKAARRLEFQVKYGDQKQSLTVKGRESPSSSFIQITPMDNEMRFGGIARYMVNMTTHTQEELLFTITSASNSSYLRNGSTSAVGASTEIAFPVDAEMGPSGRLLVYYIRSDKEIVAAVAPVKATIIRNEVTISVKTSHGDYAQPGEQALFRVVTSPSSLVGFLAMDESLLILKSGNDISASDLNAVAAGGQSLDSDLYSVDDYFQKSDLFLLTNQKVTNSKEKERPKPRPHIRRPMWGAIGGIRKGVGMMAVNNFASASGLDGVALGGTIAKTAAPAVPVSSEPANAEPQKTRMDFRQSFLFETGFASLNGLLEKSAVVPDTITTWRITAFGLSNDTGLGVSTVPARLKVFQPFFAVLNLPYSIIRGENLTVDVLVFNYLSTSQRVTVKLHLLDFSNSTEDFESSVVVDADESRKASFIVVPEVIGDMTIRVTAQSPEAADQVEKKLPVKPEGVKQYYNKPVFVDLRKSNKFSTNIALPGDPKGLVDGSSRVEVRAVGDILGPAINNLDGLVRLPTGCGEQNMALTAPNVVIARYLRATQKHNPDLDEKLSANIRLGYQRELTYRHADNSYSAWGKSDPKGSTWLTAYVARVFIQAAEFASDVDDSVIKTAVRFLVDQQNDDGSFSENGVIVDKKYQGGAGAGVALTAFSLLPFLDYVQKYPSIPRFEESTSKAVAYLEKRLLELSNDTFALAITSYALTRANSSKASDALALLDQFATKNGSALFWSSSVSLEPTKDGLMSFSTDSKDVEGTAYALLAYLSAGRMESTFPIVSWLLSKQSSAGGFASTQDTVVGLTALAEYASSVVNQPDLGLTIQASFDAYPELTINSENAMVMQTVFIDVKPKKISLQATGKGTALVHVSWTYNVVTPPEDVAFDLNVTVSEAKSGLKMKICARYLRKGVSSMAVIEVNTLSGYQVDEDEIRKMRISSIPSLKKTEVENKETKVNFYFDKLTKTATCLKFATYRIYKVEDLKAQNVVVYDYYNPRDRKTRSYAL